MCGPNKHVEFILAAIIRKVPLLLSKAFIAEVEHSFMGPVVYSDKDANYKSNIDKCNSNHNAKVTSRGVMMTHFLGMIIREIITILRLSQFIIVVNS